MSVIAQEEIGTTVMADSSKLIINRLEAGHNSGNIKIVQDPRLTSILRKHIEFNKTNGVKGWRILIYKGRVMSKANQAKAEFENSFSHLSLNVSVSYREPDFLTMVGKFRTKEDAYRYKQMLISQFPQAYLVQERLTQE